MHGSFLILKDPDRTTLFKKSNIMKINILRKTFKI